MGQDTTEREILKDILGPARMVPLNVWLSTRLSACRASPTVLGENNFQRTITWCISFPGLLEEITTTLVGKVKKKKYVLNSGSLQSVSLDQNQNVGRAALPPEAEGENSLLASADNLGVLGLGLHHSNLCFHGHTAFSYISLLERSM